MAATADLTRSHLKNAREMLEMARRGLANATSDDPTERRPGIMNLATFSRSVTFVLQRLRTTDPDFDEWYAPRIAVLGDVDEQAMTVTIRRTYTEGKGLEQFVGKTRGSIRTISLSEAAMAVYRSQRRRYPDSPLVFPAPRGGYLNLRNWRHRDWQPALEAAGLEQRGPTRSATPSPPGSWLSRI
jgi:hypothetical protein